MPWGRGPQRAPARVAAFVVAAVLTGSVVVSPPRPAEAEPAPPAADGTRLVDAPDGDPVLDEVAVDTTAATRRADEDFTQAGREEAARAVTWKEREDRRLELVRLSFGASTQVGEAETALAGARAGEQAARRVLAVRKRVERRLRATLDDQQAELRRLAAAVVTSMAVDRYDFLGESGDYSAGERRDAVRSRGIQQQSDRVDAARRPWERARRSRQRQDRRVARARRAVKTAVSDLADARADREQVLERLRTAGVASAEAQARLVAAHAATAKVRIQRREARLLAPVEGVDFPLVALHAYWRASAAAPCQIPWWLIAGVGRVESRHGTAQRARLGVDGTTTTKIRGIALDGRPGTMAIRDTDGGALDGDPVWDRAVGPMQFLPGTWGRWATDDNLDATRDPHNLYDAAGAAAAYLCYRHGALVDTPARRNALFSYNRSVAYGSEVLELGESYRDAIDLPEYAPRPVPAG